MKVFFILLISFFLLTITTTVYGQVDNPQRPYIDSGDGRGVNPGDATPTKSPAQQATEKQSNIIRNAFDRIFNRNITDIPLPSNIPQPTNSNGTSGTNDTSAPEPGYTPAMTANTNETQYADSVVSIIHKSCIASTGKGVVIASNRNCVDSLQGTMIQKSIDRLKESARVFKSLQCVDCAVAMAAQRGHPYGGQGNAAQHIKQKVDNYTYYSKDTLSNPKNYQYLVPGSLGLSDQNHIWYITDVQKELNTGKPIKMRAFECNFGPAGYVRHDQTFDVDSKYFTGWQKPDNI